MLSCLPAYPAILSHNTGPSAACKIQAILGEAAFGRGLEF
jgi:hypothetical protein